jgi:hypothetical protein
VPTGFDTMSSRQKLLVGVMTAAPLWLLVHLLWRLGLDRFAVSTPYIAVSLVVLSASLAAAVALRARAGAPGRRFRRSFIWQREPSLPRWLRVSWSSPPSLRLSLSGRSRYVGHVALEGR